MGLPALDLHRLTTDERLELLERVWDSLSESKSLPLSDSQRADLDQRLDDLEREGPVGLSWDEVVREARRGSA